MLGNRTSLKADAVLFATSKIGVMAIESILKLARRQLRELERNLDQEATNQYANDLKLYRRVIQQRKNDKNKIYSLHKY